MNSGDGRVGLLDGWVGGFRFGNFPIDTRSSRPPVPSRTPRTHPGPSPDPLKSFPYVSRTFPELARPLSWPVGKPLQRISSMFDALA